MVEETGEETEEEICSGSGSGKLRGETAEAELRERLTMEVLSARRRLWKSLVRRKRVAIRGSEKTELVFALLFVFVIDCSVFLCLSLLLCIFFSISFLDSN